MVPHSRTEAFWSGTISVGIADIEQIAFLQGCVDSTRGCHLLLEVRRTVQRIQHISGIASNLDQSKADNKVLTATNEEQGRLVAELKENLQKCKAGHKTLAVTAQEQALLTNLQCELRQIKADSTRLKREAEVAKARHQDLLANHERLQSSIRLHRLQPQKCLDAVTEA